MEEIKELVINEVHYCEYVIEYDCVYLKIIQNIGLKDTKESESIFISLIEMIEGKVLNVAGYLNV